MEPLFGLVKQKYTIVSTYKISFSNEVFQTDKSLLKTEFISFLEQPPHTTEMYSQQDHRRTFMNEGGISGGGKPGKKLDDFFAKSNGSSNTG